ncbi:MAG TPA: T9SS type A sorting domain-containing protein, partial [Candidatus Kapabacteria bacterium]|nr:T9SS type A sorting domain-containing protein [Candidatus Kapabacteria bacterium]
PKTISPEVDLAPFIETGKKITGLFQTGKISEIGLHTSQQINVTLFPNPTTDKVIIQSSKKELWSIEIYDVLGAKVISYLPGTMVESATLSTTTLPVGLYTVVINHNQTMKLIKQ